jgi:hypothetical protein
MVGNDMAARDLAMRRSILSDIARKIAEAARKLVGGKRDE